MMFEGKMRVAAATLMREVAASKLMREKAVVKAA